MNGWTLTITRPCPSCTGGNDKPFHQWCPSCGRQYAPDELGNYESDILPCGHSVIMLCEANYCDDCEDTGREYRTVTLAELAALMQEEAINAHNR